MSPKLLAGLTGASQSRSSRLPWRISTASRARKVSIQASTISGLRSQRERRSVSAGRDLPNGLAFLIRRRRWRAARKRKGEAAIFDREVSVFDGSDSRADRGGGDPAVDLPHVVPDQE